MKLIEAIEINHAAVDDGATRRTFALACGFEALHLRSFLNAYLHLAFPGDRVSVAVGRFGDLAGNIERAPAGDPAGAAVVIEWPDLDPRLGLRQLAGWTPDLVEDIHRTVELNLSRIRAALDQITRSCPVAVCLPTLPLPPLGSTRTSQVSAFELELAAQAAELGKWAASNRRLRVANPEKLDRISPRGTRRDAACELFHGFPYSHPHADAVASVLAALLRDPPPKKGLITDLDGVFWRGILGEAGVSGVSWDMAGNAQIHGMYQEVLKSLTARGVLVGVASKNDAALVQEAFKRPDLRCPAERIYPICAHWRPKSESVSEILREWNIAADAVVFVDDSAMELAEVKAVHTEIECLLFSRDPGDLLPLLESLRDWFGKDAVSPEDAIRSDSIRSAAVWRAAVSGPNAAFEEFLSQTGGHIKLCIGKPGETRRAFELANKTNQFNLNGRRYTETEWDAYLSRPGTFLATMAYEDKFGPLGVILAALGEAERDGVRLDAWVMSCRAFTRRIEHQFVRLLFAQCGAAEIVFDYAETARNSPLREFLAAFHQPAAGFRLGKEEFERACPRLFHSVEIVQE